MQGTMDDQISFNSNNSNKPSASDLLAALRGTNSLKTAKASLPTPSVISFRDPQESQRDIFNQSKSLSPNKQKPKTKTVVFKGENIYLDAQKQNQEGGINPPISQKKILKGILVKRNKENSISIFGDKSMDESFKDVYPNTPTARKEDDFKFNEKSPINSQNSEGHGNSPLAFNVSPSKYIPSKLAEILKSEQQEPFEQKKLPIKKLDTSGIKVAKLRKLGSDSSSNPSSSHLKKENIERDSEKNSFSGIITNIVGERKAFLKNKETTKTDETVTNESLIFKPNTKISKLDDHFKGSFYTFLPVYGNMPSDTQLKKDVSLPTETSLHESNLRLLFDNDSSNVKALVKNILVGSKRTQDNFFSQNQVNRESNKDINDSESVISFKSRDPAPYSLKQLVQSQRSEDSSKILNQYPDAANKNLKPLSIRTWRPSLPILDKFKQERAGYVPEKTQDIQNFYLYMGKQVVKFDFKENVYKACNIPENINTGRNIGCNIEGESILICGGVNKKTFSVSASAYLLNVQVDKVEPVPDILVARYQHAVIYYDKKVYVLGGQGSGNEILKSCCVFHLEDKVWYRIPSMNYERKNLQAFASHKTGFIYAIGGTDIAGNQNFGFEKFDSKKLTWTIMPPNFPSEFNLKEFIVVGSTFPKQNSQDQKLNEEVLILSRFRDRQDENKIQYHLFAFDSDQEKLLLKGDFLYIIDEPILFATIRQDRMYIFKKGLFEVADVYILSNHQWTQEAFSAHN